MTPATDWQTLRLGYVAETIVPQRDKPEDLTGPIPWLRIEDFDGKYLGTSKSGQGVSQAQVESMPLRIFPPRTVVTSCSCIMGATAIAKRRVITNQTFIGLVPDESRVSSDFLYYVMQANQEQLQAQASGAIQQYLSQSEFRSLRFLAPSTLDDQVAIADYLDRETVRIDTLIEEQQRLIETLRERRQAVIDHEIGARSGVPSIALRGLVTVPIAAGADETSDTSNPSWWPRFVRTTDIASLTRLDPEKRVTADPESTGDAMLARNDLVATRAGATIGKTYIHLSDEPASYAGYLVRIRPNPAHVVPMYLAYWSQSRHYLDQVAVGAVKSTIENYSASKYRATRVPVPTLDEQQRVVAHLDEQTAKIDKLIDETERFIDLSRERRAALITAAVTGQIDVREVA